MDDRPFGADAINRQVDVQPKAVFSCAITLMDKIRGWEDEGCWVGSKFAACMWTCTKEALTGGQIFDREQEEYLKKRILSIMLCTVGSVQVLSSIINGCRQGEFPTGGGNFEHGTGFQNRCPMCCTKEPIMVLSAHELESNLGK